MKVFIVEDEEILAEVLKEKLEDAKLSVSVAADGEAAIPGIKSFRPDVVVLDLILPKKDGFEVLQELKTDPKLKSIPVLVLSNLGQDEEIKRALTLGADDYLVKTQHPLKEVVEKIKNYVIKSK